MVTLVYQFLANASLPESVWQVAAQSGFNAVLVLVLLGFLWYQRKDERAEREKNLKHISLLTRSVNDMLLSMAFLPKQFHDAAKDRQRESTEEDR